MSEAKFQEKILDLARSQGHFAQRFRDEVAAGIPDVFIGSPDYGLWIECKWRVWPKRAETPLLVLGDSCLRGPQLAWLLQSYHRPFGSAVIVGFPQTPQTPEGWVIIPAPFITRMGLEGANMYLKDKIMVQPPSLELMRIQMDNIEDNT